MSNTLSREPQRKRAFWLEHIKLWKRSGLSKTQYCVQNSLKASSFYNWFSKIENQREQSTAQPLLSEPVSLVPVHLQNNSVSAANIVHIERGATCVAIAADSTPEQIQHWLSTIHQLHV